MPKLKLKCFYNYNRMSSCYNRMKIIVKLIVSKRFSLITTVLWNTIQKWCQNRVVFRPINFKPLTERTNLLITVSLPYQNCIFFISVLNCRLIKELFGEPTLKCFYDYNMMNPCYNRMKIIVKLIVEQAFLFYNNCFMKHHTKIMSKPCCFSPHKF